MLPIAPVINNQLPFSLIREAAETAEQLGYDTFWVTEGFGAEAPTIIAALAEHTSTLKMGTAILPIYTRTASLLARLVFSMDQIMEGRFILGLGAGHGPHLWRDDAVVLEKPFARTRDYVHIIRESMAKGHVSYEGRVASAPNLRFPNNPVPKRPIPIYLAALGPKMAALAGEIADGVLFNAGTPDYLTEAISGLKDAARRAGRDPSEIQVGALMNACTAPNGEEICRRSMVTTLTAEMPFYQKHFRASGFGEDVDRVIAAVKDGDPEKAARGISDRLVGDLCLFGDPATWSDTLGRMEKAGVDVVCPYIGIYERKEHLMSGIRQIAGARG